MNFCVACMDCQEQLVSNSGYFTIQCEHIHIHVFTKGRHCCLWCKISTDQLKVPLNVRGYSCPRTLENIQEDYQSFLERGGNIKHAKLHNNVIHEYMWKIPIEQV